MARSRRAREIYLTPLDLELLSELRSSRTIVEACRRLKITRDTAMYRLRRLRRAGGARIVESHRGGTAGGDTRLTAQGKRLLANGPPALGLAVARGGSSAVMTNMLTGAWHARPQPHVSVEGRTALYVSFAAHEGEPLRVAIEPEAIVLAREHFRSSARNVLRGTVVSVRHLDRMRSLLRVRLDTGPMFRVAITAASETALGLRPGAVAYLYIKATAVVRQGLGPG